MSFIEGSTPRATSPGPGLRLKVVHSILAPRFVNMRVEGGGVESGLIEGDILGGNADGIIRSGMSTSSGPLV